MKKKINTTIYNKKGQCIFLMPGRMKDKKAILKIRMAFIIIIIFIYSTSNLSTAL